MSTEITDQDRKNGVSLNRAAYIFCHLNGVGSKPTGQDTYSCNPICNLYPAVCEGGRIKNLNGEAEKVKKLLEASIGVEVHI